MNFWWAFALLPLIFAATTTVVSASPETNLPVHISDPGQANSPMPAGVVAWDSLMKSLDAVVGQPTADFIFIFTNISPDNVTILTVHPSCGCTTARLPPLPWTIPAARVGQIPISVNIAGKSGTLVKTINVSTDKGSKILTVKITIPSSMPLTMSDTNRANNIKIAAADRQAVFRGDCASCHLKTGEGKAGKELYEAVCGICHEGEHRATMVTDLHRISQPTNSAFWLAWIEHGKPGTLMPAFSAGEGGPLTDSQITSLANYLAGAMPQSKPKSE